MSDNDAVDTFYGTSEAFRTVLAGGMSLQKFCSKHSDDFEKLKKIAKTKFGDLTSFSPLTEDGIVCAWITKLRFNEKMNDEQFITHIKRADVLLRGDVKTWDLQNKDPNQNDTISLMWGLQALASTQGFDNGGIKVRFPDSVADNIYEAMADAGAKKRESTHAKSTIMDKQGIGKDIANEQHRLYTPMGYGAILAHRTFKTNDNEKTENPDLYFKIEDFGFRDSLLHSFLHILGPAKKLFAGFTERNFHKKSNIAKQAEAEQGTFEKISRKEHLSALGKETSDALIGILKAIKEDKSTENANLREKFKVYTTKNKFRIGTSLFKLFYWEPTLCGADGKKIPMGAFVADLKENKNNIELIPGIEAFVKIGKIESLITATNKGTLSDRREGCEVLVDASSDKAVLMSAAGLFNEPKQKKLGSKQTSELAVSNEQSKQPISNGQSISNEKPIPITIPVTVNIDPKHSARDINNALKTTTNEANMLEEFHKIYQNEHTKFFATGSRQPIEKQGFHVMYAIKEDCDNRSIQTAQALNLIKTIRDIVSSEPKTDSSDSIKKLEAFVRKPQEVLSKKLTFELNEFITTLSPKKNAKASETFEAPPNRTVSPRAFE